MIVKRIQYLLDGRLFEWTFSGGAFWLAVETIIWPESISDGAFAQLTQVMPAHVVSIYAMLVSVIGFAALATNGYSKIWGPVVRSICATSRSYLWAQMAFSLYLVSQTRPSPSIGLGFWVLFSSAELYVAYRAMVDVQRSV